MKNYFNSNTSSNFFSYITVEFDVLMNKDYNFEDILKIIKKEFEKKLTRQEIEKTMDSNVKLGNNFFIKIIPLILKKITVNLSYIQIRKYTTTTLSNLGMIKIENGYIDYIENFLFLLSPETVEKMKCSINSYGNNLIFTFTSVLEDTKIAKCFFDFLKEKGIEIYIESNGVYGVIS